MFGSILPRQPLDRLVVAIGDGNGGEGGGGSGGGEPTPPSGGNDKSFTQQDVDRIVKERLAKAGNSSAEKVAKELGMSLEEAKAFIQEAKKEQDARKDELTRKIEEAEAKAKAGEEASATAKREALQTKIERQLVRAGVEIDPEAKEEDVEARLARLAKLVDVELDADADAIKAAVAQLKKDEPALFGKTEKEPPAPPGDPGGKPPRSHKSETAFKAGEDRAKAFAASSSTGSGKGPGGYDL